MAEFTFRPLKFDNKNTQTLMQAYSTCKALHYTVFASKQGDVILSLGKFWKEIECVC